MKIIYTKLNKFKDQFELDLLHPDFVNTYKVEFERISARELRYYPSKYIDFELSIYIGGFNATFDDFVAINSAILEHDIPQLVVEKLISRTFITKMRNMLRAYMGKFRESEVEALQAFYHRELLGIGHKSWCYVFDQQVLCESSTVLW